MVGSIVSRIDIPEGAVLVDAWVWVLAIVGGSVAVSLYVTRGDDPIERRLEDEATLRGLKAAADAKASGVREAERVAALQRAREAAEAKRDRASEAVTERVYELVLKHLPTLRRKRSQCVYLDDYGIVKGIDKWLAEIEYFRDSVLFSDAVVQKRLEELINIQEQERFLIGRKDRIYPLLEQHEDATLALCDWIDGINDDSLEIDSTDVDLDTLSGPEYEVHCAAILEAAGWSVARKGGSGDQGVDLVASLGNLRVAIQCKRYSQPVGNKAVQEVGAGRQFERCDLAAVVSTAGYTPAAKQLANSLGVLLLHHADLPSLRQVVESHAGTAV